MIILIGGAPTTGKSTMAKLLANHLNLPWISTDQIRDTMKATVTRQNYQKLFGPEGFDTPESSIDFYKKYSREEVVQIMMDEAEASWVAIKKFIEEKNRLTEGFIIEGVHILPYLVARDFKLAKGVKPLFLVDKDADRIQAVIATRGLWSKTEKYPDEVKEKELEWVTLFSQKMKTDAIEHQLPWVEMKKESDDLQSILSLLGIES